MLIAVGSCICYGEFPMPQAGCAHAVMVIARGRSPEAISNFEGEIASQKPLAMTLLRRDLVSLAANSWQKPQHEIALCQSARRLSFNVESAPFDYRDPFTQTRK